MSADRPRYTITRSKGFSRKYTFKFLNASGAWESGEGFADKEETKRMASLLATRAYEARQGLRTIEVDTSSPEPEPKSGGDGVLGWARSVLKSDETPRGPESDAPSGRVTLVFTDIEGSTRLWEELKDDFVPMLELHNRIFRELISRHAGYEVKTEGDAFMVAFASAADAVRFALEIQIELDRSDWPGGHEALRVRIGMHTGEPIVETQPNGMVDYFGWVVNRAARVSGAGHGGQILISDATHADAGDALDAAVVTDLGEHRLKGLEMPEVIRQLVPRTLEGRRFAKIKTVDLMLTNLNPSRMTFFGRQVETKRLDALLRPDAGPVMTITGTHGIGKTRLAHLWAGQHIDAFPAGVWEVVFHGGDGFTEFCTRVGAVLRCPEDRRNPSELASHIAACCEKREGGLLLLLDQLDIEDRAISETLTAWLRTVPGLRVLATRLRPLVVAGETVIPLDPLALPERGTAGDTAVGADSLRLFVERARFMNESFVLAPDQASAAAMICQALKGHPHAIEIAASRTVTWAPRVILDNLLAHLEALEQSGVTDALTAALTWSSRQLDRTLQAVYAQCSLCPDEFTVDDAARWVEVPGGASAPELSVALGSLRNNALLIRSPRERYDGAEVFSLPPASRRVADRWLDLLSIRDSVNARLRSRKLKDTRRDVFKSGKHRRSR